MPDSGSVTGEERSVIAFQLGRRPRDLTGVAARCPFGRPVVIETAPLLSDGTPNPTLLYLTCPTLAAAVSRVEAGGGVKRLRSRYAEDGVVRSGLDRLTDAYRERRDALTATAVSSLGVRPDAGVGGPRGPERASCLHAYAAALLAVRSGWLKGDLRAAEQLWAQFYPPVEECWCRDDRCAAAVTCRRRAVIDVGTISVRLLVADVRGDHVEAVTREAQITHMGEGLRPGAALTQAAAERTARGVEAFVNEARRLDTEAILVAGTSAAREAADGREFLRGLAHGLNVSAVVLSGREEAEAAYAGATLDVDGDPLVIDIGGGSTELSRRRGIRFETVSLDLGASRATERCIRSDPPRADEIECVVSEAREVFEPYRARFGTSETDESRTARPCLVGVAGTVTTIACLGHGLDTYDREVIHLSTLTLDEVRRQSERLAAMTTPERAALACVQAGRAPVIVAGAAILQATMETLGYGEMTVSERDLLDGLALHGPWSGAPGPSRAQSTGTAPGTGGAPDLGRAGR